MGPALLSIVGVDFAFGDLGGLEDLLADGGVVAVRHVVAAQVGHVVLVAAGHHRVDYRHMQMIINASQQHDY